jgi:hypothetical protein
MQQLEYIKKQGSRSRLSKRSLIHITDGNAFGLERCWSQAFGDVRSWSIPRLGTIIQQYSEMLRFAIIRACGIEGCKIFSKGRHIAPTTNKALEQDKGHCIHRLLSIDECDYRLQRLRSCCRIFELILHEPPVPCGSFFGISYLLRAIRIKDVPMREGGGKAGNGGSVFKVPHESSQEASLTEYTSTLPH